jgi:hypothetical protein
MSPGGAVLLTDLVSMLKVCAPGVVFLEADHRIRVLWRGKTYYNLPTGAHGKKPGRADIEVGYVVHIVKLFGIETCAAEQLPALKNKLPRRTAAKA